MKIKRLKQRIALPPSFNKNESFTHDLAKGLVYQWFKEAERYKRQGTACRLGDISWRKSDGVHEELPFYENSSPYYFEHEPDDKGKILFIPDICVFSRGQAYLLIEIVHSNGISEEKEAKMRKFFKNHFVEVHTINAHWVLNHTSKPNFLKTKTFYLAA